MEDDSMKIAYKNLIAKTKIDKNKNINLKIKKDLKNFEKETNFEQFFTKNKATYNLESDKYHSTYDLETIELLKNDKNLNFIKEKYIHDFFPEINYSGLKKSEFTNFSSFSLNLHNEKIFNNISPIDQNMETIENFNFRLFKYLDSYKDCYMTVDTNDNKSKRDSIKTVYVTHILNHLLKRNQEQERNSKFSNIIFKEHTLTSILKEELFVDKDLEGLKNEEIRFSNEKKEIVENNLFNLHNINTIQSILNEQTLENITLSTIKSNHENISKIIKDSVYFKVII